MCEQFGIIYKATNKINNKCYIGQTTTPLKVRITKHISNALRDNKNNYFHNAIKKYGKNNFIWEIICENVPVELLDIRETMKIIVHHSHMSEGRGYNMNWGGRTRCTYIATDETKKKLSIAQSKFVGELNQFYGKKHSNETKEKMRKARLGKHFKYSNNVVNEVIKYKRDGLSITKISQIMKIPFMTIHTWCKNQCQCQF